MLTDLSKVDTSKARVYLPNGLVEHYESQQMAYAVWLAAPSKQRLAFRGAGDKRPVYSWDFVTGK